MNEVNKTLLIPLYGKAQVSRKGIIIEDTMAEKIWNDETFQVKGKSKSKWLTYNMAMRAKIFDNWTNKMLRDNPNALVLHIGCGLDSRCLRVKQPYSTWIDGDFPDVLDIRRKYYTENEHYKMMPFNAAQSEMTATLPDNDAAIVIMEGISMYLRHEELQTLLKSLDRKYKTVHLLMDVYTTFGAKASKYKNPINDVGVTTVWGVDDINSVLTGTTLSCKAEHSLTPPEMINELPPSERWIFKLLFTGSFYRKIYRLYEIESRDE